jgi:hypothetical protein
MTKKIARQSETTPLKTIDDYLWNERLGVAQLPPVDMSQQGQPNTSSLPPQPSQAPTIDYDAANAQSDMFGSGVANTGQILAPKEPNTTPASVPARSKVAAISTLYGDVNPTPTTGESNNNGAQANRNNSSENLPNGPDATPAKGLVAEGEEGGAGLAADLGEAGSLALLASKRWVGSVLDPKEAAIEEQHSCPGCGESTDRNWVQGSCKVCGYDSSKEKENKQLEKIGGIDMSTWSERLAGTADGENLKTAKYKYIRHNKKTGKWEIWQKSTGKTLSTHDSKEKAQEAFRAMMNSMHGG